MPTYKINKAISAALTLSLGAILLGNYYANAQSSQRRLPCEEECAEHNDEPMSQTDGIVIAAMIGTIVSCVCCCLCFNNCRCPERPNVIARTNVPTTTIRRPLLEDQPPSQGLFAASQANRTFQMTSPVASNANTPASSRGPSFSEDPYERKRLGSNIESDDCLTLQSGSVAFIV